MSHPLLLRLAHLDGAVSRCATTTAAPRFLTRTGLLTRTARASAGWDPIAAGVALGYLADRRWGDPARHHPVAWFGGWAAACEHRLWAPRRSRGIAYLVVTLAPPVAGALVLDRRRPLTRTLITALVTWAALGGRSLEREAMAVHDLLAAGDLDGARHRIRSLVGRDTSQAGPDELARAVVESLAENQSDAVAATLVWGAGFGAPGVGLHRCANTLDAMIGHRTERLEQFGWAAARFDDVLNAVPARVSVLATAISCVVAGEPSRVRDVVRAVRHDAPAHPSPNAGPVEAAAAGALGVRLGGTNVYAGRTEHRGELGDGRAVDVTDIPRAVRLTRRVGRTVLVLALGARLLARRRTMN